MHAYYLQKDHKDLTKLEEELMVYEKATIDPKYLYYIICYFLFIFFISILDYLKLKDFSSSMLHCLKNLITKMKPFIWKGQLDKSLIIQA